MNEPVLGIVRTQIGCWWKKRSHCTSRIANTNIRLRVGDCGRGVAAGEKMRRVADRRALLSVLRAMKKPLKDDQRRRMRGALLEQHAHRGTIVAL